MKTLNKIFCALFVLATIGACDLDKIQAVQDELKVIVNPDAVNNKKHFSILNASDESAVSNATIVISGEVANDVYSSDGQANLLLDNGQIVIGLKQGIEVSPESPKKATAVFKAEGYLNKTIQIEFDGTPIESATVYMIPTNALPSNVEVESAENVKQSEGLSATGDNNLEIEAGTTFTKPDGTVVSGDLDIQVVTLDLLGDSESDSGFDALDEIPELISDSGDAIVPEGVIIIDPTIGGEFVLPSDLTIEIPTGKDLYAVLPDGTTILIPQPDSKSSKSNATITVTFDITAIINAYLAANGLPPITGPIVLVIALTVPEAQVCATKKVKFTNNGHAARYKFTISDGSSNIYSKNFTLYQGETVTKGGIILNSDKNYTYTVKAFTVNGKEEIISNMAIACGDLSSTIDLTDESALPSQTRNINFNIECPTVSISLTETAIYYKKDGGNTTVIFGKIVDGHLQGKVPKLDDNTDYIFNFYYTKERVSTPASGAEIEGLINNVDIDEVCTKVEAEI